MCKILDICRSRYYKYRDKDFSKTKDVHTDLIVKVFHDSHQIYGARKIKKASEDQDVILSRRRIRRIMDEQGLVSRHTVSQFKQRRQCVNRDDVKNIVDQDFGSRTKNEVIVSDLTYVRVGVKWHYICTLVDLHNRKIIGYSCGHYKDAKLVYKAFSRVKTNLFNMEYFHTDCGNEFKNKLIDFDFTFSR